MPFRPEMSMFFQAASRGFISGENVYQVGVDPLQRLQIHLDKTLPYKTNQLYNERFWVPADPVWWTYL